MTTAEAEAPTEAPDLASTPLAGSEVAIRRRMTVADKITYSRSLAVSRLLPEQYRNRPADLLFAVEYAEMLGCHPMNAVTGIHVIEGKPTASPALMSALVRRAGHKLRVRTTGSVENGDFQAMVSLVRADDPEYPFECTWTIDRAMRAGLVNEYAKQDGKWRVKARGRSGKATAWETYPEAMCKARAISEVCREGAEDCLSGLHYTAEELGANVDEDGNVIDGEVIPPVTLTGDPVHDQLALASDPWRGERPVERVTDRQWYDGWLERVARADSEGVLRGLYGEAGDQYNRLALSEEDKTAAMQAVTDRKAALDAAAAEPVDADIVPDGPQEAPEDGSEAQETPEGSS